MNGDDRCGQFVDKIYSIGVLRDVKCGGMHSSELRRDHAPGFHALIETFKLQGSPGAGNFSNLRARPATATARTAVGPA